ncbi:hypothetical protein ZIOFF_047614 [Zingiber officinale]|uniref:Uncharacterized protein n=1 Tax=Zingiber officinale TaxID=94328 RepID=A0A8J5KWW1_ZINOF|nr:hypothetical protein ZIOFF_047614 [Zingiber officinale]
MQIQEISLLGFISCKWIDLIEKFVSHSCDYLPISEQYSLLHCVVEENSKSTHPHIESLSSMEKDIIEYVAALVDSQHHKLWQLSHVLVAAVPLWAIWNDIEKRFVGEASSHIRCNGCNQEGKEHIDLDAGDEVFFDDVKRLVRVLRCVTRRWQRPSGSDGGA